MGERRLAARLLKVGHFGIHANADGTPRINVAEDDLSDAYDVGAVALGWKPMSITSNMYLDGDGRFTRGPWLDLAVRTAAGAGVQRLSWRDVNPGPKMRRRYYKVPAIVFPPSRFYEAVAMAECSFRPEVRSWTFPERLDEIVIGTQFGYPRKDILARYAWREMGAKYGLDDPAFKARFLASLPAARVRFQALAEEADAEWSKMVHSAAFRARADAAYRHLVKQVVYL